MEHLESELYLCYEHSNLYPCQERYVFSYSNNQSKAN